MVILPQVTSPQILVILPQFLGHASCPKPWSSLGRDDQELRWGDDVTWDEVTWGEMTMGEMTCKQKKVPLTYAPLILCPTSY